MKWRLYRPGIRAQLAISYTLISAVLIFSSAVVLEITLESLLASSFDTTLQMRAQQVAEGVSVAHGKLSVSAIVGELPELDATAALVDSSDLTGKSTDTMQEMKEGNDSYTNTDILVRVLDTRGKLLYNLSATRGLVLPSASITQPLQGKSWYGTLTNTRGQQIRLYSTMLVNDNTIYGIVQVGQSLVSVNKSMYTMTFLLLLLTLLALLLSAYGSYWFAGRTFGPIRHLTRIAHDISAKDMHQRVPLPRANDEVRELALIFNQMIERLEHAFRQQRRFVADASHELRTPVSVIRSITDITLAQPATVQEYVQVLQDISSESERLGMLITDLLALARADEGRVHFDQDAVRLDLLTADVLASMDTLAAERNIVLTSGELYPTVVIGDAARLIQVIMSLVENALTYTNAGGRVTLSVKANETHGVLTVCDNGIGIAPNDQAHIFERFYRTDPARSRTAGGSGLGLSIVDWIVRAHEGNVRVESQLGQGSTFTVALPLLKGEIQTSGEE